MQPPTGQLTRDFSISSSTSPSVALKWMLLLKALLARAADHSRCLFASSRMGAGGPLASHAGRSVALGGAQSHDRRREET